MSSFRGNKVRIERQKARVNRPSGMRIEDGKPVIMRTSVEDPSSPDVIHQRIIKADDFIAANAEAGFNHQQICWAITVFTFAYWDEEIRPQVARVRGVKSDEVKLDELGDLRVLRKNIVHNGGVLPSPEYAKLKVMQPLVQPDRPITLTHSFT